MVSLSMTLSDPWPGFQSHCILLLQISQKHCEIIVSSYYWTLIGSGIRSIEWRHFEWPWVTPDPGFKITVVLKGEYLQNDAFYSHIYYSTLIGNHEQAIERCHFRSHWVTHNPDFNSVARVCQLQLGFLVASSILSTRGHPYRWTKDCRSTMTVDQFFSHRINVWNSEHPPPQKKKKIRTTPNADPNSRNSSVGPTYH